jgi:hypothetical protein
VGIFKKVRQINKNINEFARLADQPGGDEWIRQNVEAQAENSGVSQSEVLVVGAEAMRQVDARDGRSVEQVMGAISQAIVTGELRFPDGRPVVQVITPPQAASIVHGVLTWTRPGFYDEFLTVAQ